MRRSRSQRRSTFLCGLVVLAAGGFAGDLAPAKERRKRRAKVSVQHSLVTPRLVGAIPWIYAVSGFVALALEVVWVRMLAMLTSMHVQSFSVMLAILLCGIAIGSAIYTKWLAGRINAVAWLIGLEILIGVWTLLSVPMFRGIRPVPLPPHGPLPMGAAPAFDTPAPPIALTMIGSKYCADADTSAFDGCDISTDR